MALLGHALALRDPLRVRQAGAQVQALQQLPDPRAPLRGSEGLPADGSGGEGRLEARNGGGDHAKQFGAGRRRSFWKVGGGLGLIKWDL